MTLEPRSIVAPWLLGGAGVIAAVGLLAGASYGPDFGEYLMWADAFRTADILELKSSTGSPLGIPMSQWSHGPGSLFAVGRVVAGGFTADLVVGWLSGLLFWWLCWRIFRELVPTSRSIPLLGMGLLFVGTHAGFYSMSHASESLSLAPIALLTWLALRRPRLQVGDALWIGVAAAVLILVRSYLAIYALPAIVRLILDLRRDGAWAYARVAVLGGLPGALALAQVGFVNRWMTGSPLQSPYVFGFGAFRSLDFAHPEFVAVLLHPLRGLLTYHPLYALGFAATAVFVVRAGQRLGRPVAAAMLFAVFVNLYVQSAWYVWWLGGRTFGMRSMVGAALPLVAGLLALLASSPSAARAVLVWGAVACAAWSFPFLMHGTPVARAWPGVVFNARRLWAEVLREDGIALLGLAAVIFLLLAWVARAERAPGVSVAASLLVASGLFYVQRVAGRTPRIEIGTRTYGALLVLLTIGCLLAVAPLVVDLLHRGSAASASAWNRPEQVAGLVLVVGLLAGSIAFVRLAIDTEGHLARGDLPHVDFSERASFQVQQWRASYVEYKSIRGFEEKKRALQEFLVRSGFLR